MQTRHQIFQFTYGFTCDCSACKFLASIGQLPAVPTERHQISELCRKLRDFVQVDSYLASDSYQSRSIQGLPPDLYLVLNESFMNKLSESFSGASHEGNHDVAAESGITLLSLYLLVYPSSYPQIGEFFSLM